MSDNLKSIIDYKDEVLNPDGGPESVLVVNHNDLEDRIIKSLGRYTGFPFVAKRDVPVGVVIPVGAFYWGENSMNKTTSFIITFSGKTIDGYGFLPVFELLNINDICKYKDFEGRACVFRITEKLTYSDTGGNPYYGLRVVGFDDNPNYTFSVNEQQSAFLEFITKSASGGGTQTLQQTLEYGSWATFTDNEKAILIDILGTEGTASLYVSLNMALLGASAGNGGYNGLQASPIKTALQYNGIQRLLFELSSSKIDEFPLEYVNESVLRLLMTDDKFLPSIGKVKSIVTESGIKNMPYYYPDWYTGIRIPLSVKNGVAQYNYDVANNIDLSSYTPYFLSPTGNDVNDGLTKLTAKKTVPSAVTAGAKLIYMLPGMYLRNTFYGAAFNPGGDLIIIGVGKVSVTNSENVALTWTLTTSNTYSTARSTVTNVLDTKYKNKYGYYSTLKQVTSQALCEAESGTYYTNNTTLWVHLSDNRVPDSDVKPQLYINSYVNSDSGKIYIENIDFYDFELRCDGLSDSSTLEIYMKNVNAAIERKSRVGLTNEYNSFRLEGFKIAVLQNCTGLETTQDIFNYHNVLGVPNSHIMELDCKAYSAGLKSLSSSNQCSSIHEDLTILRVNGNYFGGNNQVIADVGNTQSILVGCELNTESGQPNGVIYSGVNADIFGCVLGKNKILKEEGGTHNVTISNSIVSYSSIIGNVVIN